MNTLSIERDLANQYKYRKLPADLSEKYRKLFRENIPEFLDLNGANDALMDFDENPICYKYDRIVIGDYGAFVEFSDLQKADNFIIKPGQEYRVNDPKYSKNVKYIWLTIADNSNVKIYLQKRGVSYADYKPGKYYVSVHEVIKRRLIDSFDGEYAFLSNFYPSAFAVGGITYQTNEHFFQAMKTKDRDLRKKIALCNTPGEAKRIGRSIVLREDWEDVKLNVMTTGLMCKFADPVLRQKLLDTGDAILIEGNTWGDRYWGRCDGIGENHLGRLLMMLREKTRFYTMEDME